MFYFENLVSDVLFSFFQLNISRDKLRTLDIWDIENKKIALKKNEEKGRARILPPPDRAWIPITERPV